MVFDVILLLGFSFLFALFFGFRNSYQLKERNARLKGLGNDIELKYNKLWHFWQGGIQILFFSLISICLTKAGMDTVTASLVGGLGAGIFWIVFDGIVNVFGLDRNFFYVGKTAAIDRFFQRFSNPELMLGLSKLLSILIPVIIFIYNKKQSKDV